MSFLFLYDILAINKLIHALTPLFNISSCLHVSHPQQTDPIIFSHTSVHHNSFLKGIYHYDEVAASHSPRANLVPVLTRSASACPSGRMLVSIRVSRDSCLLDPSGLITVALKRKVWFNSRDKIWTYAQFFIDLMLRDNHFQNSYITHNSWTYDDDSTYF